jgi:hypothetical protein
MTDRRKLWAGLFTVGAIVIILVLAMGLERLELLPGHALKPETMPAVTGGSIPAGSDLFSLIVRGIIALLIACIPIFIIYSIFSKEGRQRLLALVIMVLLIYGFQELARILTQSNTNPVVQKFDFAQATPTLEVAATEAVFTPNPPDWLAFIISAGVALLIILLVFGILWGIWLRNRRKRDLPAEAIAKQARLAFEAIQAGEDLRETILKCYREMSRVAREAAKVKRDEGTTPHEFVNLLVNKGFPADAVRQLTLLFESVRYGREMPGKDQETQALTCLNAIVEAVKTNEKTTI